MRILIQMGSYDSKILGNRKSGKVISVSNNGNKSLKGKTMYLHPMTKGGASLLAATFRSIDIDARILPPSDPETLELANMYSSGEECLPEKVTLGDYKEITESEGFDPDQAVFLFPTANGP